MAKYNEIIYDVREAIKEYVDDSEISNDYIGYLYNIKRAKYLRQDLNNYQRTVDNSVQQTYCAALEEVPMNRCGLDFDCGTILRTKKPVPKPLELHTKTAITHVKPTTRITTPFNFTTREKVAYVDAAPYARSLYAFLDDDDYIYVYSKNDAYKLLECISISGVFENPLDLALYSTCCNCAEETPCFDEATTDYPLQPHYIDLIRTEIIRELAAGKQIPEDMKNDAD